jgi:uncharacterized membrane protein YhiD involved in acid resistance
VLSALLGAWALSQAIAGVFVRLRRDVAPARSFVVALAVAGIVSCLVVQAVGDSLARGVGLVGALALVRFRGNVSDPLDLLFVFASFAAGVACGVGALGVAVAGTALFLASVFLLDRVRFGADDAPDGLLRVTLPADDDAPVGLARSLARHCDTSVLVSLREAAGGARIEHAYHVILRDEAGGHALLRDVAALSGAEGASLVRTGVLRAS